MTGGFTLADTLVDGSIVETSLMVTDTAFALHAAADIVISHLIIENSNATITALADEFGHAVEAIALETVGGGDFTAKTVRITNDKADAKTTSILAWMDLVIASDENDGGTGLPDNNVLSAANTGAGTLELTLNAVRGNLLSDSWFDCWRFDYVTATLEAGGFIVAQDTVAVVNGSNVTINATINAPASVDVGGTRYAVYEDEDGARYYTVNPSVNDAWYKPGLSVAAVPSGAGDVDPELHCV